MNITWKIFFFSVFTMTVTFCIAGYFLIAAFFESGYERSVNSAIDLSRMFLCAFGNYMVNESDSEGVEDAIEAIADDMLKEDVRIFIADEKGNCVYADKAFRDKEEQLDMDTDNKKGISYILLREGDEYYTDEYYIRIRNQIQVGDVWYYAMTDHSVTKLFQERENELRIYNRFLLWLVVVNGLLSWILARFIVRPIRKISQGAERIADGDLTCRLSIRNQDEIGRMAENFNRMADSLAGEIAELEDVAERQEEFIGSFAHELKTPLTSIIGYADLLRSNRQTEEEQFLCANYIFQEGKRLENISLRLLELIVTGNGEIQCKKIKAARLMEETVGAMQPILEEDEIELTQDMEDRELVVEATLIRTVLMNLIDNARKAVKRGGTIRIRGGVRDDVYEIAVCDNGSGIPKEKLDRITDAFYMVDKSRSRQQGGAGLGLAICKKIIELHRGVLAFESEPGKGTSVYMRLPLKTESEKEVQDEKKSELS